VDARQQQPLRQDHDQAATGRHQREVGRHRKGLANAIRRSALWRLHLHRWAISASNILAAALFVAGCSGFFWPGLHVMSVTSFFAGSLLFLFTALASALLDHGPTPSPLTHTTESRQPQLARGGSVGPHTRRLDAVRSGLGGGAERHSVAWVWRAIRCRDREKGQPRSTTAATVSAGSSGMRLPPNRRAGGQLSPLPKLWTIGTSAPDRLHVTRHDVGHAATT
jgi:hypothetical protein